VLLSFGVGVFLQIDSDGGDVRAVKLRAAVASETIFKMGVEDGVYVGVSGDSVRAIERGYDGHTARLD